MHATKFMGIALAAALLLPGAASAAAPAGHDHDHGHEGHGGGTATLELNKGAKWKTDAPLRAGMTALRDELASALDAIHNDKYTQAQFQELGTKVEEHLVTIMVNCKLPPDADAQLHILLVDFFGGAKAMKEGDQRKEGAVKVLRSLETYAQFFDHPDWKRIAH